MHRNALGSVLLALTLAACGSTPATMLPPDAAVSDVAAAPDVSAIPDVSAPSDVPAVSDLPAVPDVSALPDVPTAPDVPADAVTQEEAPPTTGAADIERWLAGGAYRRWNCEAERHAARPGSAHSANRICTNTTLSAAAGTGEYPVGAAAVKELYGSTGALTGYAVSVRVRAGGGGAGWYWYERLAPGRVVADSTGDRGGARSICVSCHDGAPRDQVFTVVR